MGVTKKHSQETIDAVCALWTAGAMTAREIGERLGLASRCAVLGIITRAGVKLPAGEARHRQAVHTARLRAAAPAPVVKPPVVKPAAVSNQPLARSMSLRRQREAAPGEAAPPLPPDPEMPFVPRRVSLIDLTAASCRWPLGDPRAEGFAFCGVDREGAGPYCAHHHRLSLPVIYGDAARRKYLAASKAAHRTEVAAR